MKTLVSPVIALGFFLAENCAAQVTLRASVATSGLQANGTSNYSVISADGRSVFFFSNATNLVSGDTNLSSDVFVHDHNSGATERVSVSSSGSQSGGSSGFFDGLATSADGRFIAFGSSAAGLVAGDSNGMPDIFVRDRLNNTTERVSVSTSGAQSNGFSGPFGVAISDDGRFVAFGSDATNLVTPDTNFGVDVFVRDRQLGTTERVSVNSNGVQANGPSQDRVSMSADGRFVVFQSQATNLVPGDTNGWKDLFVRDRQFGTTERISVGPGGVQANSDSLSATMSADGRFVAFTSPATNLTVPGTSGLDHIFVHDRQLGTNELVSVATDGTPADRKSDVPSISADGRYVAFRSLAGSLVGENGTVLNWDIFVRDRQSGTTARVDVSTGGVLGTSVLGNGWPSISGNGRFVDFTSDATNLVAGDTNGVSDVFVHDNAASGFTSLCGPGADGVMACPCSNPPSGANRGCNNSAATGGATLTASGFAYLSMESLVFAASGERPTSLSILMQGNAVIASGVGFGQGVRCVGGTIIRRLFLKNASGGSVLFPDSAQGDPSISARSASLGDTINAGESRWYLAYYRDPVVPDGCAAAQAFNATQTGQISWSP